MELSKSVQQNSKLHNKLKSFGLNPSEWSLRRSYKNFYRIVNKDQPEIIFLGKAQIKKNKIDWLELRLAA